MIKPLLLTLLFAGFVPLAGCSRNTEEAAATPAPYEGEYENNRGNVVLELKEGRAIFTNPRTREKTDTSFSTDP
jgi:hypothetical protein